MTTTVSTTTVSMFSSVAFATTFALIVTLTLIVLLIGRDAAGHGEERQSRWSQPLNVAIAPLLVSFSIIAGTALFAALT